MQRKIAHYFFNATEYLFGGCSCRSLRDSRKQCIGRSIIQIFCKFSQNLSFFDILYCAVYLFRNHFPIVNLYGILYNYIFASCRFLLIEQICIIKVLNKLSKFPSH